MTLGEEVRVDEPAEDRRLLARGVPLAEPRVEAVLPVDGVEADVDDEAVPRAPLDAREGLAVLVAEGRLDQ